MGVRGRFFSLVERRQGAFFSTGSRAESTQKKASHGERLTGLKWLKRE